VGDDAEASRARDRRPLPRASRETAQSRQDADVASQSPDRRLRLV